MNGLKTIRNYICYCGIEKDEYNSLKKEAYISNFTIWRVLHCLLAAVFGFLFVSSMSVDIMELNRPFYFIAFIYSAAAACLFLFKLKKDSVIAQLVIYLSISLLLVFGCLISQTNPGSTATTFIVILLLTPLFMIDKPYFMAFEIIAASVIYLYWMYNIKPYNIWQLDLGNTIVFSFVSIFLHMLSNSIRIKQFVLAREITIQKDTDELTGLKNKGAMTREINGFLADGSKNKGIMLVLDIDHFKAVNDTYGHDAGDMVIRKLGDFLKQQFTGDEIVGRFGGDEFIVFIKDNDEAAFAEKKAKEIIDNVSEYVVLPEISEPVSVSAGIAIYRGVEKNYSEIFKKADMALYKSKSDRTVKYCFAEES